MEHLTMNGRRVPCRMCNHNAKYIYHINDHNVTLCFDCLLRMTSFNHNYESYRAKHNGKWSYAIPHKYKGGHQWTPYFTYDDIDEYVLDNEGNMYKVDFKYDYLLKKVGRLITPAKCLIKLYPQKNDSLDDIIAMSMEYHKGTLRRLAE